MILLIQNKSHFAKIKEKNVGGFLYWEDEKLWGYSNNKNPGSISPLNPSRDNEIELLFFLFFFPKKK